MQSNPNVIEAIKIALEDKQKVEKAFTISTSNALNRYELDPTVKMLISTLFPIEADSPIETVLGSDAAHFKIVNQRVGGGYRFGTGIPEGMSGVQMTIGTATKTFPFVTFGIDEKTSFEAVNAGKGDPEFDVRALAIEALLQTFKQDTLEFADLGGNTSNGLAAPTGVVVTIASASGGSLANTTSCIVVPLTLAGYYNSAVTGGVATTQTATTAANETFTQYGGTGPKSAAATAGAGAGSANQIQIAWNPVPNAIAYALFWGAAGAETLGAIVTTTKPYIAKAAATGTVIGNGVILASALTADYSKDPYTYDGLITQAWANCGTAGAPGVVNSYCKFISSTWTAKNGTITQVDDALQSQFDSNRIGPEKFLVSSVEARTLRDAIISGGASPLVRFTTELSQQAPELNAGFVLGWYTNPFLNRSIKMEVHPFLPQGHFFGYTMSLPAAYIMNGVGNTWKIIQRDPIHAIDWMNISRYYRTGVYTERVLCVQVPQALLYIGDIYAS